MKGGSDIARIVNIQGAEYRHVETLKADTVATTCIYEGPTGRFIVKMARPHPALLILGGVVARYLVSREAAMFRRLEGIEGVPRFIERTGPRSFVRQYVAGRVLDKKKPVPDDFFDRLHQTVRAIHGSGIAHTDIEKPENILVGKDGKPYVIDFQIGFCIHHVPSFVRPLAAPILRCLMAADIYHLYKHKRRTRPDLTTPEEERLGRRAGILLDIHRFLTRPYFFIRRNLVKVRGEEAPPGGYPEAQG